jgi:hypothetical protein
MIIALGLLEIIFSIPLAIRGSSSSRKQKVTLLKYGFNLLTVCTNAVLALLSLLP